MIMVNESTFALKTDDLGRFSVNLIYYLKRWNES